MTHSPYRYVIELKRQNHSTLGQFPVTMDWGPACEWAWFMALRGRRDGHAPCHGDATVTPEWDGSLGEPYVDGVRIALGGNGAALPHVLLPRAYFNRVAIETGRTLAAQEVLQPREKFRYAVMAFRSSTPTPSPRGLTLTVEDIAAPLALGRARHAERLARAAAFGREQEEDIPVFVPQRVLSHAEALTRSAGAVETAGVLIGHLYRAEEGGDLFVEITDLIPAKHTRAESMQVTFTPETWAAVEGAIQLRRGGEMMLGWFHSHPARFWCSPDCPPEARRNCPLSRSFFSAEDCALHRTVFPMAYSVALLVTHAESGLRHALFGWRQGLIVQRGFQVLDAVSNLVESEHCEAIIGEYHEETCL